MAELKLTPVELRSFYFESGKEHTPPDKVARQGYKGYRTWSIKTWKSSAYKIIGRIIFDKNQLKTLQNTKITKITILYTTESPTPKKTSSIHARKIQLNEYNSSNQNFNYDSCGNLIGSFNGSQENPGKERTYELSESSTGDDQNLFQGLVSYLQRPDTQGIVLGTDAPYFRDGITDSFIYENYITLDENFISLTNFILEVEYSKGISSDTSNLTIGKEQISPSLITFNINPVEGANIYKIGFDNVEIGTITNTSQDVFTYTWDNVADYKDNILQSLSSTTGGSIEIYCHPYNGNEALEGNNSIFTLNVTIDNNIVPNIGKIESTEGVSNISDLNLDHFVQSKSLIKISAPISPGDGASITSCELSLFDSLFECDSQDDNKYIWNIQLSDKAYEDLYGTFNYAITVIDSRGRSVTKTGSITIDQYFEPRISLFKAIRTDQSGTASLIDNYVKFQIEAQVPSLLSSNNEKNQINISIKNSDETHNYYSTSTHLTEFSVTSGAYALQPTDSSTKDDHFTISVTDILNTSRTQGSTLGQQSTVLDFVGNNDGEAGMAIGTTATASDIGCIRLGWPLKFKDETVKQETVKALDITQPTLPFKIAYGHALAKTDGEVAISYNFGTIVPFIFVTYSKTDTNEAGDDGIPKVFGKTATGANIILSGSGQKTRDVDWIAIAPLSS